MNLQSMRMQPSRMRRVVNLNQMARRASLERLYLGWVKSLGRALEAEGPVVSGGCRTGCWEDGRECGSRWWWGVLIEKRCDFDFWGLLQVAPKYTTMACWLFWLKVILETASARGTLDLTSMSLESRRQISPGKVALPCTRRQEDSLITRNGILAEKPV